MSDNEHELEREQTSSAISHSLTKSVGIPIILKHDNYSTLTFANKDMAECSTWIYCMDEEGIVGKLCRDNDIECAVKRYVYRPDLYLVGGASLVCCGVLHFITVSFIMVALKKLNPRINLPPPLSYCVRANVDA